MNSKLCKKLRKEARKYSSSQETNYTVTGQTRFFSGQLTLARGCFRAVYQEAKKILKTGVDSFGIKHA